MNSIHLNSVTQRGIGDFVTNARLFVLLITTFILLLPLAVQADGLFNFQMKLAEKGNAEAQYKVGEMYETGFGVKQDMKQARSWITKSAGQGHETASFKLLYWDVEKNGLTGENKTKVDALNTKAAAGNAQAQYYVGKMHAHGIGVKKNPDKAITWLNKAALVGVLAAERELTAVREDKQRRDLARQKAQRRAHADVNKQAEVELKATQKQAQLEKQRQGQAQQKAKQRAYADEKKQAELQLKARQEQAQLEKTNKAAADARLAVEKQAVQQAKIVAQAEATARKREAQKQASLKKRAANEKKQKIQFESDPCSGKSARFLSTCR